MGSLIYGSLNTEISFDDRALMHLQIVITAKLRRHESFLFSWTDAAKGGTTRSSIWLHPSTTLFYRFSGSRIPALNRESAVHCRTKPPQLHTQHRANAGAALTCPVSFPNFFFLS
jgi:hypothetical protein